MKSTSMAGVPMNCINWLALGAVVYGAMDKRNALKSIGIKGTNKCRYVTTID